MKLYAVHDVKANALASFFVEKSDAVATRNFAAAVMQEKSVFGAYPDDFQLVSVALVREDVEKGLQQVIATDMDVVVTARQVMDLRAKPQDPAQLSLIKEA